MNRETFGIQRRTENPWAALMQPNQVDLSFLNLQPQEEASNGIGEAIASGIGSIGGAWAGKMNKDKFLKEGGISKDKWKAMKSLGNIPELNMLGSGRIFGYGGKLKQGLNIVGDQGPEIAIKEGEDVEILPMDKLHPGQNARQKYGNPPMEEVMAEETVVEPPVMPQMSPADKTYAEISRREGKDWKGKDRAKTHNWKDVIKSILLGAARAGQSVGRGDNATSSIGKLLGGAIAGGVGTAVDRNADEKLGNEMMLEKLRGTYGQQYPMEQQRSQDALKARIGEAQAVNLEGKPALAQLEAQRKQRALDLQEFKAINDADYKVNLIELGTAKADEVRKNNERIFNLKQRGADQMDKRIQILEKRNEEIARSNKAKEGIAQTRESNIGRRQQIAIAAQKEAATIREAEKNGRQAEAIAARERLAKLKAEDDTLTGTKNEVSGTLGVGPQQ